MSLGQVWNALLSVVTRGKVVAGQPGTQRPALQLEMLAGEVYNRVPLMLPYGMSAIPAAGDVLVFSVGATRDHKVALCADNSALRITDLAGGEFGFRDGAGQQVVFRSDRLEVTSPLKVVITATSDIELTSQTNVVVSAPAVYVGGAGGRRVVLDGDPVSTGGTVTATGTITWGA